MQITPTDKGALFAGAGVWSLIWLSIFKLDTIAKKFHVDRWVSKDKLLGKINHNKGITLLITEAINFGVHGASRPDAAIYALGGTFVNAIFVFIVNPIRFLIRREKGEVTL